MLYPCSHFTLAKCCCDLKSVVDSMFLAIEIAIVCQHRQAFTGGNVLLCHAAQHTLTPCLVC